jgi:hypothetical protein
LLVGLVIGFSKAAFGEMIVRMAGSVGDEMAVGLGTVCWMGSASATCSLLAKSDNGSSIAAPLGATFCSGGVAEDRGDLFALFIATKIATANIIPTNKSMYKASAESLDI